MTKKWVWILLYTLCIQKWQAIVCHYEAANAGRRWIVSVVIIFQNFRVLFYLAWCIVLRDDGYRLARIGFSDIKRCTNIKTGVNNQVIAWHHQTQTRADTYWKFDWIIIIIEFGTYAVDKVHLCQSNGIYLLFWTWLLWCVGITPAIWWFCFLFHNDDDDIIAHSFIYSFRLSEYTNFNQKNYHELSYVVIWWVNTVIWPNGYKVNVNIGTFEHEKWIWQINFSTEPVPN